jgi:hypothetical protein
MTNLIVAALGLTTLAAAPVPAEPAKGRIVEVEPAKTYRLQLASGLPLIVELSEPMSAPPTCVDCASEDDTRFRFDLAQDSRSVVLSAEEPPVIQVGTSAPVGRPRTRLRTLRVPTAKGLLVLEVEHFVFKGIADRRVVFHFPSSQQQPVLAHCEIPTRGDCGACAVACPVSEAAECIPGAVLPPGSPVKSGNGSCLRAPVCRCVPSATASTK